MIDRKPDLCPRRRRHLVILCLSMILSAVPLLAGAVPSFLVIQRNRQFQFATMALSAGDTVAFENRDDFQHQIHVDGPGMDIDSDLQGPGERTQIRFSNAGLFRVTCGIHPRMRLAITVS